MDYAMVAVGQGGPDMQPYSMDLRRRVLAASDAGLGTAAVAEKFDVSPAWVRRLKQRRRESGEIAPRVQRHGPLPKLAGCMRELAELIRSQPDATEQELADRLSVKVSDSTVHRALERLRLTYKKRR
jgi:transposase